MAPGRRSWGKLAAWGSGLALVGVVAFGVMSWQDLAKAYHLFRLREHPELLESLCEAPEASAQGRAVRAFVKEPDGARALVRLLLTAIPFKQFVPQPISSSYQATPVVTVNSADRAILGWTKFETDSLTVAMEAAKKGPEQYQLQLGEKAKLLFRLATESLHTEAYHSGPPDCFVKSLPVDEAVQLYLEASAVFQNPLRGEELEGEYAVLLYKPGKLVPHQTFQPLPTWLKKL